ncbi:MAG TPA: hypothetical protein VGA03_04540, partial [Anaerolineales bacterium]
MRSETGRSLGAWAYTRALFSRRNNGGYRRGSSPVAWIILILGLLYFFLPLFSVFEFSLKMIKDTYSFEAYRVAFTDPRFFQNFGYSVLWALLTIVLSLLL